MKIEFPNPENAARLQILRIHSRRMNMQRGLDLRKTASDANGAGGAELKGSVRKQECSRCGREEFT
jgi:26S proteasome regulatory subunit T6